MSIGAYKYYKIHYILRTIILIEKKHDRQKNSTVFIDASHTGTFLKF